MSYTIDWLIEPHIIETCLTGAISQDEMAQNNTDIIRLAELGVSPLYLIVDTYGVTKFPPNFREMLQDMRRHAETGNIEFTVVLSNNTLLNFFSVLAAKTIGIPVRVCKTREEALKFIAHNIPELAYQLAAVEAEIS